MPAALSLFSGIGLHDLGLQRAGWRIVGQAETDPWCLAVLEKHWPGLPRWEDVRDVSARSVADRCGPIDLVTGGFPCQDISAAGRGAGLGGSRSGLWHEMLRVVREVRPAWVFAENVPALRTRGAGVVVSGLEEAGYTVLPPVVVGAWACGAPHRRDRCWIVARLADSDCERRDGIDPLLQRREPRQDRAEAAGGGALMAHADAALRHQSGRSGWPLGAGAPEPGGGGPELADPARDGQRRERPPERPDRERAGAGGDAGLADAEGGGLRADGRPPGRPGHAHQRDEGLADPALDGLQGSGHEEARQGATGERRRPTDARWPARPGEPQHGWEEPRLAYAYEAGREGTGAGARARRAGPTEGSAGPPESGVGRAVDGRARRLDGFARRCRLRALGNANPPAVPELIGRWMLATMSTPTP